MEVSKYTNDSHLKDEKAHLLIVPEDFDDKLCGSWDRNIYGGRPVLRQSSIQEIPLWSELYYSASYVWTLQTRNSINDVDWTEKEGIILKQASMHCIEYDFLSWQLVRDKNKSTNIEREGSQHSLKCTIAQQTIDVILNHNANSVYSVELVKKGV